MNAFPVVLAAYELLRDPEARAAIDRALEAAARRQQRQHGSETSPGVELAEVWNDLRTASARSACLHARPAAARTRAARSCGSS